MILKNLSLISHEKNTSFGPFYAGQNLNVTGILERCNDKYFNTILHNIKDEKASGFALICIFARKNNEKVKLPLIISSFNSSPKRKGSPKAIKTLMPL